MLLKDSGEICTKLFEPNTNSGWQQSAGPSGSTLHYAAFYSMTLKSKLLYGLKIPVKNNTALPEMQVKAVL